jgi:GxxExxY protein
MSEVVIIEKELSYLIMQAAFEVHNILGPGYPEKIYEEAMFRELTSRGVEVERQKRVIVIYKGEPLGEFFLDNVANKRVILEYKAVKEIERIHEQQALSYLKATGLELAIVINFGAERVQSSRVVLTNGKGKIPPRLPRTRLEDHKR